VLHNVGNVLNSVNISAKVVAEKIKQSELPSLMKVSEMIRAHQHDLPAFLVSDERGKLVPEFISDLAGCLGEEQRHMLAEVSALANGIEHIKQIVAAQQKLAKKSNVATASDPAELMETALTMQKGPDGEIEIIRKFGDGVLVALDQHKVIQILVNLISNARHAVKASGVEQKRIVLGVEVIQTDEASGRARFEVKDNGVGISHENLSRIFAHGFTTKSNGHGFGLHSAANAAKEMGGSLTVHSDGPGKGAIFTLDIPVTSERAGATCKL